MQSVDNNYLVRQKALSLGFLECAILPVEELTAEREHYNSWIDQGMHGEMGYMERNVDKRINPELLFEGARTIIIVLQSYATHIKQHDPDAPVLSKYAYGTDYHFIVKDKLRQLLDYIREEITPCNGRPFTDSAPFLERAWAKRGGLGWIGRHSNLISVTHGSYFFIGELLIDAELPYDEPRLVRDHCGTCTRCVDACPTKAIVADRVVDARKCISYQTIELKGELDPDLHGKFENRVFGCDICQDVCPWNLKAQPHDQPEFNPSPELLSLSRSDWFRLDKAQFNNVFRNSPVKRTGFNGLQRNLRFIARNDNEQTI